MQLRIDRVQQAPRFFGFEIQVTVARDAKRCGGKNFVSVIEPVGESMHNVVNKNVIRAALSRRKQYEPRQGAREGDDSEMDL